MPWAGNVAPRRERRVAIGRRPDSATGPVGSVAAMKALRSFTVRPSLPPELAALEELAMNLRWSWDAQTRDVFKWVDPDAWDASVHDPVGVLGVVPRERLDALVDDPGFMRFLGEVRDEHQRYLDGDRWFQARERLAPASRSPTSPPSSASPRRSPSTRAASACWPATTSRRAATSACRSSASASSTGTATSASRCRPTAGSRSATPTSIRTPWRSRPCDGVTVEVDLAGAPLVARVWKAEVGRVPLYLLDADVEENAPDLRAITDRLYGGDTEHRLRQEILLGIGGVRALDALGIDAQVFHTNEGHAGFLGLERIRQLVKDPGLSYREAIEAVRAACIFTTHTPVPAGIDRFPASSSSATSPGGPARWASASTSSWRSATVRATSPTSASTWR